MRKLPGSSVGTMPSPDPLHPCAEHSNSAWTQREGERLRTTIPVHPQRLDISNDGLATLAGWVESLSPHLAADADTLHAQINYYVWFMHPAEDKALVDVVTHL